MRRDHHRHPARGELADHVEHLGDELRVEGARDLVEEEQLGLHRERPHDRDALLLAAGEPVGVLVALVGEAEALEQRGRLRIGLASRLPERLAGRQGHVLEHGHVREEVERLEHDPDPPPQRVDVDVAGGDLRAADPDPPGLDRLEQVDAAQKRRLAGARRTDQADDLVLADVEVDPAQHLELAERLVHALDPKHRGDVGFSLTSGFSLTPTSPPGAASDRARSASR